ncbi:MAG: septum formation protein Maf [Chloroflexi bacterium]|nr:septum formation protein Maf [Chloroflexota bacterium]
MNERPLLVLASNSPRRKDLIALAGLPFEIIVSNVDETPRANESPRNYVVRLAEEKARASSLFADASQVVLAADTTVVDANALLGKPADPSEAKRMLRQLRGRVHQVYTGIAALRVSDGHLVRDVCVTDVPMRDYSDAEIDNYVATGDPLDKAGAYAIQHAQFQPVASMAGCFASVMGLPLCHVTRLLLQMDVLPSAEASAACQSFLKYECPVFKEILAPQVSPHFFQNGGTEGG